MVAGDGAAVVHREFIQGGKLVIGQQVPNELAGGLVKNDSGRALIGRVVGQQDNGAVEGAVFQ